MIARERGIEIVEQIVSKKGDFSTLIQADVTTDKKTYTAAGTLFGNQFLRLVQLGRITSTPTWTASWFSSLTAMCRA